MKLNDVNEQMKSEANTLSMQQTLRQAIFDSISESDITAICKRQVEKAKDGDEASLQFVMKYMLGFGTPVKLQQINVNTDAQTAVQIAKSR